MSEDAAPQSVVKSDSEWRTVLSPQQVKYTKPLNRTACSHPIPALQFRVLREKGTESPNTGKFNKLDEPGVYCCAACNAPLYKSATKFNSGCGWPSFLMVCHRASDLSGSWANDVIYSHPRSSLTTHRQISLDETCRNHLHGVRWPSWTCFRRRRFPHPKCVLV